MHKTGRVVQCDICSKDFYRAGFHLRRHKSILCSVGCAGKLHSLNKKGVASPLRSPQLPDRQCKKCNKVFGVRDTKKGRVRVFCSLSCATIWRNKSVENREKVRFALSGEKQYNWKGDNASYFTIHSWLRRKYGSAYKCEKCGTKNSPKYEWANISKEYKRDVKDYIQLCNSCHSLYDNKSKKRLETMRRASGKLQERI